MSNSKSDFSFYSSDWFKPEKQPRKATMRKKKASKKKTIKSEIKGKYPNQAKFLHHYRTELRKISQEQLGREFGLEDTQVARQTISDIERGKRGIIIQHAINLSDLDFKRFAKAYIKDAELNFSERLRAHGIEVG